MSMNEKDAESTISTINESSHPSHQPHAIDHLHIDPTATTVATLPNSAQDTTASSKGMDPTNSVDRPKNVSVNPPGPVVEGFWKSRFAIRPGFKGDPREELSRFRKTVILCVIAQAGCLGGFSSTIYFPSLVKIKDELGTSQTAINASVSLFILFMGIAPLVASTLSDTFKIRRILYIVFTIVFTIASLGGGFAKSVAPLIIARVFQAIGSGGASILGAGTVADIFAPAEQGTSMGLFFLGQFLGPLLGPPIGGVLAENFGWESTFFFMAALSAIVILQLFFLLPDTFRIEPKDELDTLEESADASPEQKPTRKFINPFQAVFLLKHPVVLLSSIETGIIFALMFSIETIVPDLFTRFYGLGESMTGLTYLGAGVGSVLGSVLGGKLSDLSLMRNKDKNNGELVLEDRLAPNMWIAGFLIVPFGSLLFGWGAEKHLNIAAPIIGFAIYNFGMGQVLSAGAAYLVNAIPGQGSSATAAGNFLRMIMACVFSLTAQLIVDGIGYGYYSVILAVLNFGAMGLFYIVKLKGAEMRASAVRSEAQRLKKL
ncbi:hypothetical protein BGW38_000947 [Lunasporangiospora selenospora]|uniref:Major facilitator superfamily (MFS) profile domain-containing protein n=1 Tax=Lunasporangiospora selenospora TaxID=979761 RepID=A0A9P6KEF8_9FUNG|nr:hypothetical protein BGW38_000947 [Lunasporangiospora selenospora]